MNLDKKFKIKIGKESLISFFKVNQIKDFLKKLKPKKKELPANFDDKSRTFTNKEWVKIKQKVVEKPLLPDFPEQGRSYLKPVFEQGSELTRSESGNIICTGIYIMDDRFSRNGGYIISG